MNYNPAAGIRTNGNVEVTLTISKKITTISNGRSPNGVNTYTKTYTANGGETVNFADSAGNT